MPARSKAVQEISGKLGAVRRWSPDADTTEIERNLKAASADDYIRRLVDSAPPLSDMQRARLAALLLPVPRGDAA